MEGAEAVGAALDELATPVADAKREYPAAASQSLPSTIKPAVMRGSENMIAAMGPAPRSERADFCQWVMVQHH